VVNLARRERLTVRELIRRLGGGRGHLTFAGTPGQVADAIAHWYHHGAADGFNIMAPGAALRPCVLCGRRGADPAAARPVSRRVRGHTLRDNYGLARPGNRNTVTAVVASAPAR
jgi:hypothetical protein